MSMKKSLFWAFLLFLPHLLHAYAPAYIHYQAIARSSSGAILANRDLAIKFSIRENTPTGSVEYMEKHFLTTSAEGMFSLNIGQGDPIFGTFSEIKWGSNPKYLQIEMDTTGTGASYVDMGTQQLMSVPYSLFSNAINPIVSATGDTVFFGGGKYIIFPGVSAANCDVSAGTITGTSTICTGSTTTLSNEVSGGSWASSSPSVATVNSTGLVTGISAGTVTISYRVIGHCGVVYATKIITVNSVPYAGVITGATSVCIGASISLSSSVTGGSWSSSNTGIISVDSSGSVTGVSVGTATISYSVANSCGVAILTRGIVANSIPFLDPIFGDSTVNVSSSITLLMPAPIYGGTWSSSDTNIATISPYGMLNGLSTGTVTISYSLSNECGTNTVTKLITVDTPGITVGSSYGGGTVAYIYQYGDPGYVAGEVHGIIATPYDMTGLPFGCMGVHAGTYIFELGTGASNTSLLSDACGDGTAARYCSDLVLGGYSDWHLPSAYEMQKLYDNRSLIEGFTYYTHYWTSTEDALILTNAFYIDFYAGGINYAYRTEIKAVRPVRYF